MPNGAATTGRDAYFIAMQAAWKRRIAVSSSSHSPSCAASSTIIRLAPDAEILAVVGHHQRLETAIHLVERAGHHLHHVLAQRIHLAVELQAEHAVSQVHQRGAGVGLHHAARALDLAEHDHARTFLQVGVPARIRGRSSVFRARPRDRRPRRNSARPMPACAPRSRESRSRRGACAPPSPARRARPTARRARA